MWSVDAYDYIERRASGAVDDRGERHLSRLVHRRQPDRRVGQRRLRRRRTSRGRGALGGLLRHAARAARIKMGDSPSVGYLLHGTPDDPTAAGLGRPVRPRLGWTQDDVQSADDRGGHASRHSASSRSSLPLPAGMTRNQSARMIIDGRIPAIATNDGRVLRFRFSPRDAKVWPYVIRSDHPALDGRHGPVHRRCRRQPDRDRAGHRAPHPHWWTDRSRPGRRRGRPSGRPDGRPLARGVPRRLRRAPAPRSGRHPRAASRASSSSPTSRTSPTTRMSMVRFLTYANQWDVEGLVATTSVHQKDRTVGRRGSGRSSRPTARSATTSRSTSPAIPSAD